MKDLEEAIRRAQQAAAATPDDHPSLVWRLNNLGNKLERRFERTRRLEDLEEAILRAEQAVAATLDDHPDLAGRPNNLGNKLARRFEQSGRLKDLEKAIRRAEKAVVATTPDHPGLAKRQNKLEELRESIRQAEQARTRKLGDGHPYSETDQWQATLQLTEQVVEVEKQKLGQEHPSTLTSMNGLASRYSEIGRRGEAQQLTEQVMAIMRRKLGEEYPDAREGWLSKEAEQVYRRTLALRERSPSLSPVPANLPPSTTPARLAEPG
jgi:tetratricopeptide (TPR) repeat protein